MLELKDLGAFELAVAQTDAEQLVKAANTALESASTFVVTDADSFEDATRIAGRIKSIEKQVEELTEPAIKAAHERHRALTNARGAILTKLTTARAAINKRALDWRTEQQRREADAQRERERIAREQAEAERKRIEDERLQAAMDAERAGDAKSAEAILSAPPPVVEPVAVVSRTEVPKPTGASIRTKYEYTVTDPMQLPREFLMPCDAVIRARVNAMGLQANIPGVKVKAVESMSNRAA